MNEKDLFDKIGLIDDRIVSASEYPDEHRRFLNSIRWKLKLLLIFAALLMLVLLPEIISRLHKPDSDYPVFDLTEDLELRDEWIATEGRYAGSTVYQRYRVSSVECDDPVKCVFADPNNGDILLYGFVQYGTSEETWYEAVASLPFVFFSESDFRVTVHETWNYPLKYMREQTRDLEIHPGETRVINGRQYYIYYGDLSFLNTDLVSVNHAVVYPYDDSYADSRVRTAGPDAEDKIRAYIDNILYKYLGSEPDVQSLTPDPETTEEAQVREALSRYLASAEEYSEISVDDCTIVPVPCYEATADGLIPHRLYRKYAMFYEGECLQTAEYYYNEAAPFASARPFQLDTTGSILPDSRYLYYSDSVYLCNGDDMIYDWYLSIPTVNDIRDTESFGAGRRYRAFLATFPGRLPADEATIDKETGQ